MKNLAKRPDFEFSSGDSNFPTIDSRTTKTTNDKYHHNEPVNEGHDNHSRDRGEEGKGKRNNDGRRRKNDGRHYEPIRNTTVYATRATEVTHVTVT